MPDDAQHQRDDRQGGGLLAAVRSRRAHRERLAAGSPGAGRSRLAVAAGCPLAVAAGTAPTAGSTAAPRAGAAVGAGWTSGGVLPGAGGGYSLLMGCPSRVRPGWFAIRGHEPIHSGRVRALGRTRSPCRIHERSRPEGPRMSVLDDIVAGVREDLAVRRAALSEADLVAAVRGPPGAPRPDAGLPRPGSLGDRRGQAPVAEQGRPRRHPRPGRPGRGLLRGRRRRDLGADRAASLRRQPRRPARGARGRDDPGAAQGLRGDRLPAARGPGRRCRPGPADRRRPRRRPARRAARAGPRPSG